MDEIYEMIQKWCDSNLFARHSQIGLRACEPDRVVLEMPVNERNLNPLGMLHGGAFFTLADSCGGAAVRTCSGGTPYVTISSSINYHHGAAPGDTVAATGVVRRRGRNTCYVEVEIHNQDGVLLASACLTYFRVGGK